MYKKKKDLLPTVIANYFEAEPRPGHNYNLRTRRNESHSFRSNTAIGKKSIQNEGEMLWRELPQYLKDVDSNLSFKKLYKAHLIETG